MLDAEEARVAGAVVVAGEQVAVLLAQTGVVVWLAAVDLGLLGPDAGVEDAVFPQNQSVRRRTWMRDLVRRKGD